MIPDTMTVSSVISGVAPLVAFAAPALVIGITLAFGWKALSKSKKFTR